MKWKVLPVVAILLVLVVCVGVAILLITQNGEAQKAPMDSSTDPQTLLIPRWFLAGLTLNGQKVEIATGQQSITIQFTPEGKVNGKGGCNSFSASYQANPDGKLSFSPVISTKMACADSMQTESAYFSALAKVQQFKLVSGQLMLSSSDGQTQLTYKRPPK
jgi:putative lipoprotein